MDETTDLRALLGRVRSIAVVGASPKPDRPSYGVIGFLKARGYKLALINPGQAGGEIQGLPVFATLADIPEAFGPVDMVEIFRASEHAGQVVDDAMAHLSARGLSTIWMQLGVINEAAAARAEAAGLTVVMDRCPAIELTK